jgi:hypothetical protein
MTNFEDDDEWGNLTAGGLSHDDIINKNWNHITAAKARMSNPKIVEKLSKTITKKQNEKKYLEHMSRQRNESMDKIIEDEGITLREKLTEANRKSAANPIHHANRTKANRRMKKNTNYQKSHKKGCWEACGYTITTPCGEYPAMNEFDRQNNFIVGTCAVYCKTLPHLFYKTEDGPGEPAYERLIHTPYGIFLSIPDAYKFAKQQGDVEANKLKNLDNWFIKMCLFYPKKYSMTFQIAKYWPLEKNSPKDYYKKPKFKYDRMQKLNDLWLKKLEGSKSIYKTLKKG